MSNKRSGQQPKQSYGGEAGPHSAPGDYRLNSPSGRGSKITSEIQAALDQQVVRGARTITNVARSAKRAADELENDAPQIASLVRGVADRVEEYSRDLETQSVTDIYQAARDFTRRQPAVVFGAAALAGFFALRTLKSSSTRSAGGRPIASRGGGQFHGS